MLGFAQSCWLLVIALVQHRKAAWGPTHVLRQSSSTRRSGILSDLQITVDWWGPGVDQSVVLSEEHCTKSPPICALQCSWWIHLLCCSSLMTCCMGDTQRYSSQPSHVDSKNQNKVHGSAVTIQLAPRIYSPDRHDRRPQQLWVRIQVIAHYTFSDFTINMCQCMVRR